ncbi:MAG: large-conductance mechanosensitive channel [Verrucomicrobia bacterium A1]|nr:MAG: large-conductance mechanosensitive channel [Verrucomicrobia bacterium A1]
MSIIKEFREFAIKGNMIDMAVGIIIGGAFGKIVSSLVADVLMPPLGMLMGGVDFADKMITLREAAEGVTAVQIKYGAFINNTIDFLIVALAVFMMVKAINKLKRQEAAAPTPPAVPPPPTVQETLLAEIRDLLKKRSVAKEPE